MKKLLSYIGQFIISCLGIIIFQLLGATFGEAITILIMLNILVLLEVHLNN